MIRFFFVGGDVLFAIAGMNAVDELEDLIDVHFLVVQGVRADRVVLVLVELLEVLLSRVIGRLGQFGGSLLDPWFGFQDFVT